MRPHARRLDGFALAAALLAAVMAVVYVVVIRGQDEQPLAWVLAVLAVGSALTLYASPTSSPHRRPALAVAGVLLTLLGLLAILTIGLPIVAAGVLALVASARRPVFLDSAGAPPP